jgi:PBSX family phage portal protein
MAWLGQEGAIRPEGVAGPEYDKGVAEPPRERVTKAVEDSLAADDGRGKVMKVLFLDDEGKSVGEWASTQIPEDPFRGTTQAGLVEPPFPLAQLVFLAEMHPVHSSALEQKTVDICGKGWEWSADDDDDDDEAEKNKLEDWLESLAPDEFDIREVVQSVWLDAETLGWGMFEIARDPAGIAKRIYHVPGHTVRAHKDGFRLCQIREERKVWFRRWGCPDVDGKRVEIDVKTGSKTTIREPANDLFVIRRPSRRSTWYGIPGYVSAIGWITLALAARDDNLFFFANRREPRWAIVLSNLQDDDDLEGQLRRAFTVDLRQPHRNIIVPITGPGKVDFQKLSDNRQEGSFDRLSERADTAITVAHRVPAERIANAAVGQLGGNIALEASRIYKEGVVAPSQELLANRLNRFIDVEYGKMLGQDVFEPTHKLVLDEVDIQSDRETLSQTVIAFHGDLITLREARHRLKLGPLMRKKLPPAPAPTPQAPPADEPVLDPVTQKPVLDDAGKPVMKPGAPAPPPPRPVPAEMPSTEDITEEEESPYNEMLFTELPGAGGAAGMPGMNPAGADRLTPGTEEPKFGSRSGDELDAISRQLVRSARALEQRIEEIASP